MKHALDIICYLLPICFEYGGIVAIVAFTSCFDIVIIYLKIALTYRKFEKQSSCEIRNLNSFSYQVTFMLKLTLRANCKNIFLYQTHPSDCQLELNFLRSSR